MDVRTNFKSLVEDMFCFYEDRRPPNLFACIVSADWELRARRGVLRNSRAICQVSFDVDETSERGVTVLS